MNSPILSSLDSLPYFTIEAVRQLSNGSASTVRTAVYRWMKSGELIQLKNGTYVTRRFFDRHHDDADFAPMVSAVLIPQSYISLEYVLQRYGVLTEMTYPVSAVTLKHGRTITNSIGTFSYRSIKTDLYNGFQIHDYLGVPFAMAGKARALFDFLYFRHWGDELSSPVFDLVEDLRLNLDEFAQDDWLEFNRYVEVSRNRKMQSVVKNIGRKG
jgi:predicted transcriptional regulator of viral defense system